MFTAPGNYNIQLIVTLNLIQDGVIRKPVCVKILLLFAEVDYEIVYF